MGRRSGWTTALAASAALWTSPAHARDEVYAVSIPAGYLADVLETLSAQTGISYAYEARLPAIATRAVRGRMSAREALDRLLRDTPVRAVRIGRKTFRLVRRRGRETPAGDAQPSEGGPVRNEEIVVTARKQPEPLSGVAAPVSVYAPSDSDGTGSEATRDVARELEGLSVTNLGPGQDRPFIRGLADSPFNGFSQSTVSVQVDEGRVTYNAPEPDLRLVDVARVEVLKGPQGPLYGTGALGGVYRIITNRPVMGAASAHGGIHAEAVASGGIGTSGEAVLNLPLSADAAALRLVGYARDDAGWIDDIPRPKDANRARTLGGRAALRIVPATGWTVDFSGILQSIRADDSQYVDRDFEDLTRAARIREPQRSRFALAQGTVAGPIGTLRFTGVVSHAWQDQDNVLDASGAADALGVPGASAYRDRRFYRVFNQEARIGSAPGSVLAWTAGLSNISATTRATGSVATATGTVPDYFSLHRRVTETAVFAESSYPLLDDLRFALGLRLFRATTEDERLEALEHKAVTHGLWGFTPSASLSYSFSPTRIVYAHVGSAFRPGGLDPSNTGTGRYVGDEVRSVDVGVRALLADGTIEIELAAFHASWKHVQSDYLEPNGLVATRNAGDATIPGLEASMNWRLPGGWRLAAGAAFQKPRLVHGPDGEELPHDRRLPVVPDLTGRLRVERSWQWFGRRMTAYAGANFVGASRLSFDDGLDRRMGGYVLTRLGSTIAFDGFDFGVGVDNVLNARADTFAYGNPFSIRNERQFTPLKPRTATLTISRAF